MAEINYFKLARDTMSRRLHEDPDLRYGYLSNIAMTINDAVNVKPFNMGTDEEPEWIGVPLDVHKVEDCNILAERLLKLIFD